MDSSGEFPDVYADEVSQSQSDWADSANYESIPERSLDEPGGFASGIRGVFDQSSATTFVKSGPSEPVTRINYNLSFKRTMLDAITSLEQDYRDQVSSRYNHEDEDDQQQSFIMSIERALMHVAFLKGASQGRSREQDIKNAEGARAELKLAEGALTAIQTDCWNRELYQDETEFFETFAKMGIKFQQLKESLLRGRAPQVEVSDLDHSVIFSEQDTSVLGQNDGVKSSGPCSMITSLPKFVHYDPTKTYFIEEDGDNRIFKRRLPGRGLQRVCETCRGRKCKCDMIRPSCSTCTRLKTTCIHTNPIDSSAANQGEED